MNTNPWIVLANATHREILIRLLSHIEAEENPEYPRAEARASTDVRQSLEHFDVLSSDSTWCLLAFVNEEPVGLALLTRIPKLDGRIGFLYVDELQVLGPWRRLGIGRALLERSTALSHELGLAGVRLLARIDNAPARSLYEQFGFHGGETMLYQYLLDRENAES